MTTATPHLILTVEARNLFAGDLWRKDDGTEWIVTVGAEWNGVQCDDTCHGGRDVTWTAAQARGEHKGRASRFVAAETCTLLVTPEYAWLGI